MTDFFRSLTRFSPKAWWVAAQAERRDLPRSFQLTIAAVRCIGAFLILGEFLSPQHHAAAWVIESLVFGAFYTVFLLLLELRPDGGYRRVIWWITPFVEAALIGVIFWGLGPNGNFGWLVLVHLIGCYLQYGARFSTPVVIQHTLQLLALETIHPPRYPSADLLLVVISWGFYFTFVHLQKQRTQQAQDARAERERLAELESLTNAKLQFINIASHELRTPLTVVKGYARLIQTIAPQMAPELLDFANEIRRAADRMTLLVDELLEFGRIESGQLRLLNDSFDLDRLVTDIAKVLSMLANERNQRISLRLEAGHEPRWGDSRRIEQAILNLAHNALKYAPADSVIELRTLAIADRCRIEVRDQGAGIDPEHLNHLFTPFFRAGAEHSGTEGIGLGLAICRAIVRAHDGQIGYQREDDQTVFWIEAPLARGAMPLASAIFES